MIANKKTKSGGFGKIGISAVSSILANKKRKTMMISVMAGIGIIVVVFQVSQATGNQTIRDLGIIAGVMIMVIPLVVKQIAENKRRDSVDSNLPIFLLSLVSSVTSGSSLLRAVEDAADRRMGALTPELKNLRANISWGMPYHEAFDNFTKKVGTKLARRVGVLLQISMDIGGNVTDTLELIQKHVSEMQNIEKERKASLSPYIYTIYIAFVVFIAVTVLLVSNFFTEIETVQLKLKETAKTTHVPLGMFATILGISVKDIDSVMFNMSLIEAVFGGIAAGKIGEGSFLGGIKHSIVMIVIAIMAFAVMGGLG